MYEMAYARVPTVTIDLPIILIATSKLIKLSMNGLRKYSIVIKYFSKPYNVIRGVSIWLD